MHAKNAIRERRASTRPPRNHIISPQPQLLKTNNPAGPFISPLLPSAMPEPGFQHKGNIATINPFDEDTLKLSPYTVAEIATLQSRLDRQLGPEYISSRPGAGGIKVHYLAAEKVINLANEVFGFNGWSSSIRNIQIDFVGISLEECGRRQESLLPIARWMNQRKGGSAWGYP